MAFRPMNIHNVSPRENLDRFAFLLAFALGVLGGLLLKIAGAHPFVTASYAALILVAYALVAWAGGRIKIEPEAIGDNCYYLGFLFTLASLAFTLYQMADPAANGGKPADIPEVISGFGVALSSTIVGVFLRVFMMQMRPDFVAKDRAVRADLNQSYADFRKNLSGTMSQMKAFSTESIQYAAERDERLRVSTEKFVEDHHQALQSAANTLSENMEKSFSEATQSALKEISATVQETTIASQAAIQELVQDIQNLKDRLNEQEAQSFEEIQSRRKRFVADLEAAEKRMKDHDIAMDSYIKITRRAADSMTKRMVPALDQLKDRLDSLPATDAPYNFSDPVPADLEAAIDEPFTVNVKRGSSSFQKRSDS